MTSTMDMQGIMLSEVEDAAKILSKLKVAVIASPVYTQEIHREAATLAYRVSVLLGHVSRWELMDGL